ncbi:MAG: hypothetical protein ACE15C_18940 [Phycisphaerae bacterium]
MDVGLALAFAGLSYLAWAGVAGLARWFVQEMIRTTEFHSIKVEGWTKLVRVFFVDSGFVIDIVGVVWMVLTLLLVFQSSRQRISISWAWMSAMLQSFAAAGGAMLVGWAAYLPHVLSPDKLQKKTSLAQEVSMRSLPIIMPIAVLIWVTVLVWLLVERARLDRRGPTLSDGMRTNIFR